MKTYSPSQITESTIETYPFIGDWNKLFEEPDIRFTTLIRGEAKSGKSTYCAKFAQYVSQFGKVLYVSAEERIKSKTLQNRIKLCGVVSEKVRFVHVKSIEEIDSLIKTGGYRFAIIDSIQHVKMTLDDFMNLKKKYARRKLSFHAVMQMGVNITQWKHEVDVLIEVKQGWAQVHGRYNAATRMQVFKQNNQQQSLFD